MGYGRLGSSESIRFPNLFQSQREEPSTSKSTQKGKRKLIILGVLSFVLIVAAVASAGLVVVLRPATHRWTCPRSLNAGERDLVHISVNMTLQRVGKALYDVSDISNPQMDLLVRSVYGYCLELVEDSVDQLSRSLVSVAPPAEGGGQKGAVGSTQDVLMWLSAALTKQDTCTEGFDDVSGGYVKDQMTGKLKDLSA